MKEEIKSATDLLKWLQDERNILQNTSALMWHKPDEQVKVNRVANLLDKAVRYIELSKIIK